jgi:hypothetical protein
MLLCTDEQGYVQSGINCEWYQTDPSYNGSSTETDEQLNKTKLNLANDQLYAQIFNTFITILYMYMFQAISCSSSGGQIELIQHLVLSLSVSDHPMHRFRKKFSLNLCTGRSLTESDDTRYCVNMIWPPDDEQDIARNMLRIVINVLKFVHKVGHWLRLY